MEKTRTKRQIEWQRMAPEGEGGCWSVLRTTPQSGPYLNANVTLHKSRRHGSRARCSI